MDRLHRPFAQACLPVYPVEKRSDSERQTRFEELDFEQDYPMDAFDRQLLARYPSEWSSQAGQISANYSFVASGRLPNEHCNPGQDFRDSLLDIQSLHSSSSPTLPVSSPTVSALRNRSQITQRVKPAMADGGRFEPQTTKVKEHRLMDNFRSNEPPLTTSFNTSNAPPIIQGISLVPTAKLPDHLRSIFKFELFNAVQSKCFSAAFETDDNIILSAPTGSGKTAIMELSICRLLRISGNDDFKVVYQAPTKSLCNERFRDWAARFKTLNIQCAEITGDAEYAQFRAVQSAHVIITTPEKWDSITRKWRDHAKLMQMIKLFLVDEVHILNDTRGATLEAVVSRMKTAGSGVRFVALSATVPNSDDIAAWLGRSPTAQHLPAHREVFDETFRPAKLEKHVVGYKCSPNEFALDGLLTKELPSIIARHAKKKPAMIFCVTKSSATKTANRLADLWLATTAHLRFWNPPQQQINVVNPELQKILPTGVAFHHSGLDATDRRSIEQGFLRGDINIICSTSTLAVGINLPCYLVVLKGTSCWTDSGLQEYSSLDVMQMIGRAGRPQYETSACAVILTHIDKVRHYEAMVTGQEVLESSLHKNLIEHLNAEIGIGTIYNVESAKRWLASSFLSVRLRRNPTYYRLQGSDTYQSAEQLLEQICERDLNLLERGQLIEQRKEFRCTEYGDAMARYYVQYETMLEFIGLTAKPRVSDILNVLCRAREFKDLKIRAGEKAMYKELNKANDIRYPIKVDLALPIHKTSLIIQSHLGGVILDKSQAKYAGQFKQDLLMVMSHCNRLIRCIIDMQIHRQDATAVKNALELCRSLAAGVWDNTPMQLKQIESIGDVTARKLAAAGINSIDVLLNTEPHRIEVVLGKSQPFGSALLKKAIKFPNLRVSVKEVDKKRRGPSGGVEVRLRSEIGSLNDSLPAFFNRRAVYICFLCETSHGKLVDFRRFAAKRLQGDEQVCLCVPLDQPCDFIKCHVMCDEVAGTHRHAELRLDIPAEWFPRSVSRQDNTIGVEKDRTTTHPDNAFDDTSLDDDDFLAAETGVDEVDIVEDIGTILQAQNTTSNDKNPLKRKATTTTEGEVSNEKTKEYRESVQLPNGNWTCQHTCKEERKDCKHHCCKEGVKKPRKRVKAKASSAQLSGSAQDTFAKTLTQDSQSMMDQTFPTEDNSRKRMRSVSQLSTRDECNQAKKSHNISNTILPPVDTQESGHIWDIEDLDSDDLPSMKAILSQSSMTKDHNPVCDNNFAHHTDDYGIDDLQIGNAGVGCDNKDLGNTFVQLPTATRGLTASSRPKTALTSESEIGLKEVSLSEPTIPTTIASEDALSFSSDKAASKFLDQTPIQVVQEIDYFNDVDDADLAILDHNLCLETLPCVGNRNNRQNFALPESQGNMPPQAIENNIHQSDEAEKARQRELHREDQKKKWAELPAWMYEEYGAYVDLI